MLCAIFHVAQPVTSVSLTRHNKEYDTIAGFKPFRDAAVKLFFANDCPPLDTLATAVALSGTGALRLAATLLFNVVPARTNVYVSNPTWANHFPIFVQTGFQNMKYYRYFKAQTNSLDFDGMLQDLTEAPLGSVVIFHICGHNPTGVDPNAEQWERLCALSKERRFRVIFDSAYQGYATGDLDRDAFAARLFVKRGVQFITCQSFSKNMGLYGDRVGCISVVCGNADTADRVQRFINAFGVRPNYSNPPRRGARVAHLVLTDAALRKDWEEELRGMSQRIQAMRQLLFDELKRLGTPGTWNHIVDQIGMFSYLGLKPDVCRRLVREHSVYLLETGRISIAGLTVENTPRLAKAIDTVLRSAKPSKL
jgi:aspartate/tyrosine/aromatic aminotransferase